MTTNRKRNDIFLMSRPDGTIVANLWTYDLRIFPTVYPVTPSSMHRIHKATMPGIGTLSATVSAGACGLMNARIHR